MNVPNYKFGIYTPIHTIQTYYPLTTPIKSMIHDMCITKNYIITHENSIQFNEKAILSGKIFDFNYNHTFKLGLQLKNSNTSSSITWHNYDLPLGLMHYMNAWEEVNNKGEK